MRISGNWVIGNKKIIFEIEFRVTFILFKTTYSEPKLSINDTTLLSLRNPHEIRMSTTFVRACYLRAHCGRRAVYIDWWREQNLLKEYRDLSVDIFQRISIPLESDQIYIKASTEGCLNDIKLFMGSQRSYFWCLFVHICAATMEEINTKMML